MQFPNTKQTQMTERIMRAFSKFGGDKKIIELDVPIYNKVYSRIYSILCEEMEGEDG